MSAIQKAIFYNPDLVLQDYIASKHRRILGRVDRQKRNAVENAVPVRGQRQVYRILKKGDSFMTSLKLHYEISALSQTGGTFVRMCNYGGVYAMDHMDLVQHGEVVESITADQIVMYYKHNLKADEAAFEKLNIGREDVDATRNTNGTAVQRFTIDLGNVFGLFSKPLPMFLMNDNLEIHVYWRGPDATSYIQHDGASPTFTFTETFMDVEWTKAYGEQLVPNYVRKVHMQSGGWKLYEYERFDVKQTLNSGATAYAIPVSALNNRDVINMHIILRLVSEVTHATLRDYSNYQILKDYSLKSGSDNIHGLQQPITNAYYKQILLDSYRVTGRQDVDGENLYMISYSDGLDEEYAHDNKHHHYNGSKDFAGVSDAQLEINFASNLAANVEATISINAAKRKVIRGGQIRDQ